MPFHFNQIRSVAGAKKIERRNKINIEGVKGRKGVKSTGRRKCKYPFGEYHSASRENFFLVGKQKQRRRNAKGELEKKREGRKKQAVVMLFSFLSAWSIATVLHRVGIHFNEFAFQERIILLSFILVLCFFFLLLFTFLLPIDI